MRKCIHCGQEIPAGRLKAKPDANTCVSCSATGKVAGFALITGKNEYSALQIVDQETFARLTRLQERKGYGVANGVKTDLDAGKVYNHKT